MARYKPIHQGLKLLAVDFDRQILPGTFEYALRHLVDNELDLEGFHQRYKNAVSYTHLDVYKRQLLWLHVMDQTRWTSSTMLKAK